MDEGSSALDQFICNDLGAYGLVSRNWGRFCSFGEAMMIAGWIARSMSDNDGI